MRWKNILELDEPLCWEGRPAPRCYVFRNWIHSFFGLVLLLVTAFWQESGIEMAAEYQSIWLAWLPLPFLLLALYLTFGHIILSRFEWNRVYYAVTDRRLLIQRGLFQLRVISVALEDVTYFRLQPHGKALGSFKIYSQGEARSLSFLCVEYPQKVVDLLEAAMGDKTQPLSSEITG
jgi:hypothetical protein